MNHKMRSHSQDIHEYIHGISVRLPECMEELIQVTEKMPDAMMATAPVQGQFLHFLMKSMGAKRAIEVGVFTGVGTMWMANAVGDDGLVVACDLEEEFVSVGRPFWEKAGIAGRIDVRLAPAQETLQAMVREGDAGSFDFCYIDADKGSYDIYYELCLALLRVGGVIAFDNMLLGGRVADSAVVDEPVPSIRALLEKLHTDERVHVTFLAIGDGLYLAQKQG